MKIQGWGSNARCCRKHDADAVVVGERVGRTVEVRFTRELRDAHYEHLIVKMTSEEARILANRILDMVASAELPAA